MDWSASSEMYVTKAQLYGYIEYLRKNILGISLNDYPLDLVSICKNHPRLELEFHNFNGKKVMGYTIKCGDFSVILVNKFKSLKEQQWIVGHEMIHAFMHPEENRFHLKTAMPIETESGLEWQANEGSSELLVPYRLFLPQVKERYDEMTTYRRGVTRFCNEAAEMYRVTPYLIQNRLISLKYEIEQYVCQGVPLEAVKVLSRKRQALRGIYCKNLVECAAEMALTYENLVVNA